MSNQWETVGRKKNRPEVKKLPVDVKKKVQKDQHDVRVEEILPMSQVKSLFKNPQSRIPQKEKPKEKENGIKKPQKKASEPPKAKPPKNIESALNNINPEEFKEVYESTKTKFPDATILWLKEMSQFLNQKVPVEVMDPTFGSHKQGYPFSIVPQSLRSTITVAIKDVGKTCTQIFFDQSLIAMATDISKNLPAVGHRIFIQYLATAEPSLATSNFGKVATLRNSYQNRPNIGLSILWGVGQAGLKDFQAGLKVFQELMLPVIDMKNYTRYCIQYLVELLQRHAVSTLTKDQFLLIFDVWSAPYKNYPADLRQRLQNGLGQLHKKVPSDKLHLLVDPLLKRISEGSNEIKKVASELTVQCLIQDKNSFGVLEKAYSKNVPACAFLLEFIDQHWASYSSGLNQKQFFDALDAYAALNGELSSKKWKDTQLPIAIKTVNKLKTRMASNKKKQESSSNFLLFAVLLTIGALTLYDIKKNTWEKSQTLTGLNYVRNHEYVQIASVKSREVLHSAHLKLDKQFPGYYEKTSEILEPYVQLSKDMALISYNILQNMKDAVMAKYPVVLQTIELYMPGLIDGVQNVAQNVWSTSVLYFNKTFTYLQTKVFVGTLAPENMQRVMLEAFNVTQQKATEYYTWIRNKIHSV